MPRVTKNIPFDCVRKSTEHTAFSFQGEFPGYQEFDAIQCISIILVLCAADQIKSWNCEVRIKNEQQYKLYIKTHLFNNSPAWEQWPFLHRARIRKLDRGRNQQKKVQETNPMETMLSDGENTTRPRRSRRSMHKQKNILKEQQRVITSSAQKGGHWVPQSGR